jgi:ribosomal protein S18 acetylase RimI-like enzyme
VPAVADAESGRVSVRPARSQDAEAVIAADRLTWTSATSPAPPPQDWTVTDPTAVVRDLLVAELDGRVVGYVRLIRASDLPSHQHVRALEGLAVHPDAQGRGVGRALVLAAVEAARAAGARKLSLRVLGPNAPARALYARCGFVEEGVLRGEFVLDGEPVDDVLMALFLQPPAAPADAP